jgi:hypothetical protein
MRRLRRMILGNRGDLENTALDDELIEMLVVGKSL